MCCGLAAMLVLAGLERIGSFDSREGSWRSFELLLPPLEIDCAKALVVDRLGEAGNFGKDRRSGTVGWGAVILTDPKLEIFS